MRQTKNLSTCIVLLALLAWPATDVAANEPPDSTALGIPGQGYSPPFSGFYMVRHPGLLTDGVTFSIVTGPWPDPEPNPLPSRLQQGWGVPPEAMDRKAAGAATLAPPPGPAYQAGFWYTQLRGTTPGWVKLEIYKQGILFQAVYYRFYKPFMIEDDTGDSYGYYKGFDPRYGASSTGTVFPELGGPYDQGNQANDPPAESIYGYDDRFLGQSDWTGTPMARSLIWKPEAMLKGSSLMFNKRNDQTIRIFLEGPREPALVPIWLRCLDHGDGSIGGSGGSAYEIKADFTPHDPLTSTMPGNWVRTTGGLPNVPILRHLLIDAPPEPTTGNGTWMLRWPVTGTAFSSYKGDIEIEVKIPNPSNVWTKYGAQAGDQEGVMHGRVGTVYEYVKYDVWFSEPNDLDDLKNFWYRQVCHKFENQPQVDTPDNATQGFGAVILAGSRSGDTAHMEIKDAASSAIDDSEWADSYFDKEVWQPTVNTKMSAEADPDPGQNEDNSFYCFWTQAEHPDDISEPWSSTHPSSIELSYRSYIGMIDVDVPQTVQFGAEHLEAKADKKVPQHWINVVADMNDDGLITDADDGDAVEEEEPGLIINAYNDADVPGSPNGRDPHSGLRVILVKLSEKPSGMNDSWTNYSIVIELAGASNGMEEGARLYFWNNIDGTGEIPLLELKPGGSKGWVRPITGADGFTIRILVGGKDTGITAGTLAFSVARNPEPTKKIFAYKRLHRDNIFISKGTFGIDIDSNNDGTVDLDDDAVESESVAFLKIDDPETMILRKYEWYDDIVNTTAKLESTVSGRVSVMTQGGVNRLAPPPTPTTSYAWTAATEAEIKGQGSVTYDLVGHKAGADDYGEVDLTARISSGIKIVAYDWVRCRTVGIDLEWDGVDEEDEESDGGYVLLNFDNDNHSDPVDNTNGFVPETRDFDTSPIEDENDLKKITLTVDGAGADGTIRLRAVNSGEGRIKVWKSTASQSGLKKAEELALPAEWTDEADVPDELWVEGCQNGRALRDVDLVLEFETDGDKVDDTVKVTINPVVEYHLAENPVNPNLTTVTGWLRARIEFRARANFKDCPGVLNYVHTIDTSNWTLNYTAASGLPSLTFHYGGEPFADTNGNGSFDGGEEWTDLDNNGAYTQGEPYVDTNGNGSHDGGETFTNWDNNEGHTAEFFPPFLDAASQPPPAGTYAASVFYHQQQLADTKNGDYREKEDNDNPGVGWSILPNLASLSTLDADFDYRLHLVVRLQEHGGQVIYPLARLEWSVSWHTTFTAGVPNAPTSPAAQTTFEAATFDGSMPLLLISPIFNVLTNPGVYR